MFVPLTSPTPQEVIGQQFPAKRMTFTNNYASCFASFFFFFFPLLKLSIHLFSFNLFDLCTFLYHKTHEVIGRGTGKDKAMMRVTYFFFVCLPSYPRAILGLYSLFTSVWESTDTVLESWSCLH